jgi:tetrahydromethanopterin S-methyltransferase subunit A
MDPDLYPWGGEYVTGNPDSPFAVVTLAEELDLPLEKVAIHGKMKTENLGIEKVIANVISNPIIRFVVIFGEDIRGHRAGKSLLALHAHGLDEMRRIRNAPGAVPYIENLNDEAIARFRAQVEMIDLIGETDQSVLMDHISHVLERETEPFGEPFIAIRIREESSASVAMGDSIALHRSLLLSPFLEIATMQTPESGLHLHRSIIVHVNGRVEPA